jgi:hypothetical protein
MYNRMRSISLLKGIEYYSVSRKRMRIFYEDAYAINTPGEKKKIPDPLVTEIPATSTVYCYFKDSSFGEYTCSMEYSMEGDSISIRMRNLTQVWYFMIPLIKPGKMLSYFLIIPIENMILFYGFFCIKGEDTFGLAESKADSLYNRIKALYNWFVESPAK